MRVTVCELSDEPEALPRDWDRLAAHVRAESSDLVLLPEMPFSPWFALTREFDRAVWDAAVADHERWLARLPELAPATVLGSRPLNQADRRLNEGFIWDAETGYRRTHLKYHLPDEEGFWEASWYDRGDGRFTVSRAGAALVGFMICTDLWFLQHAREYGQAGAQLVASPRATPAVTVDKWLAGGRVAAVVSGAFGLSSNRSSAREHPVVFGGLGWIVGPDGEVLGTTSPEHPMVTVEIDLAAADRAKRTYPRYVAD